MVCARTAREGLVMSESGSIADLSQHTVMPYAERGWICVSGSHVCVYACCSARLKRPGCCTLCILLSSGGHGLPKSRFLLHKLLLHFIAHLLCASIWRRVTSTVKGVTNSILYCNPHQPACPAGSIGRRSVLYKSLHTQKWTGSS